MKTSVIVPCISKHLFLLAPLLESFCRQSVLPDEIVISISEIEDCQYMEIQRIQNQNWPFQLVLLYCKEKNSTGKNRNIAAASSCGNILILQDADDIPHPQRVEIIKYVFEHYNIDYMIHQWMPGDEWREKSPLSFKKCLPDFIHYKHKDIRKSLIPIEKVAVSSKEIEKLQTLADVIHSRLFKLCESRMQYITWGQTGMTRRVFEKIKWTEDYRQGEDVVFGYKVMKKFHKFFLLPMPLIKYQIEYSSY